MMDNGQLLIFVLMANYCISGERLNLECTI